MDIKDLVRNIYKELVNQPDEVEVVEEDSEDGRVLVVEVAEEDKPLCIGKKGKNAESMRNLVLMWGYTHDQRVTLVVGSSHEVS